MSDELGLERTWRVTRTSSRRWIVERLVRRETGEERRETSAIYPDRKLAERALLDSMRRGALIADQRVFSARLPGWVS